MTCLETAWGNSLPRDLRLIATHLRVVSILSEEEYAAFRPPEKIEKFPDDLTRPDLEYSGMYEEGWAGKEFKVRLTQHAPERELVFRGQIPRLPGHEQFKTELTVLIDGHPVHKRALAPGDFEVRFPAGAETGPRWIEFRFSDALVLPSPDGPPPSCW